MVFKTTMPDTYDFTGTWVTALGFLGLLTSFLVVYTALVYFSQVND